MRRRRIARSPSGLFALLAAATALSGCADKLDAGGAAVDAGSDDNPLAVDDTAAPGSLDALHRDIIAPRCSGQPGLCHNGQFEPNLSTPALAYAYLVNRPSLEKPTRLRVNPGAPEDSVIIDKLRGRDVATRMPLGAAPLEESEIAALEAWIADGALRRPGADPAPVLNNPPRRPEIRIFDAAGDRIDGAGITTVAVGQTITLRHTVQDFETADAAIPLAAFILAGASDRNLVLRPDAPSDLDLGVTSYDPGGPMGLGDQLDYRLDVAIPATLGLVDNNGVVVEVPAAGQLFTPIAVYIDALPGGIATFTIAANPIEIE